MPTSTEHLTNPSDEPTQPPSNLSVIFTKQELEELEWWRNNPNAMLSPTTYAKYIQNISEQGM